MITKVKVTINNAALAEALGKKAGDKVDVECKNGIPVDRYWRGRFKDSELDGSITIPAPKKTPKEAE